MAEHCNVLKFLFYFSLEIKTLPKWISCHSDVVTRKQMHIRPRGVGVEMAPYAQELAHTYTHKTHESHKSLDPARRRLGAL